MVACTFSTCGFNISSWLLLTSFTCSWCALIFFNMSSICRFFISSDFSIFSLIEASAATRAASRLASSSFWAFSILPMCSDTLSLTSASSFAFFSSAACSLASFALLIFSTLAFSLSSFFCWAMSILANWLDKFLILSVSMLFFLSSASFNFCSILAWVGAADGEVGGETLLLGFLTAGESTISKDLPPRVSNNCLVAASTSAISSSLAWGRGSSTSRSPALSALAGEVTKVVGGVLEAGLLESPTLGGVEAGLVSELPAGASGFLVEFDEPLPLSDFSDD